MASRCQVPGSLTLQSDMGGHAKVNMHSRAAEILRSLPGHIADKILAGLRRSRISPAEAFAAIDTNGDGQLQEDEFAAGLRALQVDLSDGQFAVVLSKFDMVNLSQAQAASPCRRLPPAAVDAASARTHTLTTS